MSRNININPLCSGRIALAISRLTHSSAMNEFGWLIAPKSVTDSLEIA